MPSSGYTALVFTAGEVPTTAQWNILWSNDASFSSGAGFNDAILQSRHFTAGSIAPTALALTSAFTGGIGSFTPGTSLLSNLVIGAISGNTLSIGGLKLVWARVSYSLVTGVGSVNISLGGFLSTLQYMGVFISAEGGSPYQATSMFTFSSNNCYFSIFLCNPGDAGIAHILAIGT